MSGQPLVKIFGLAPPSDRNGTQLSASPSPHGKASSSPAGSLPVVPGLHSCKGQEMTFWSHHRPLTAARGRPHKRRVSRIASHQPSGWLESRRLRFLRIDPIFGGLRVLACPPGLHLAFLFSLFPLRGAPVFLSCDISRCPSCQTSRTKDVTW